MSFQKKIIKTLFYFSREEAAIRQLVGVSKDTGIGGPLEGAHIHIVHLSDSSASLDLIKVLWSLSCLVKIKCGIYQFTGLLMLYIYTVQEAKSRGDSISVETCPHYLAFTSEEIPNGDTRYKCSPPIRDAQNKDKLWEAVLVCFLSTNTLYCVTLIIYDLIVFLFVYLIYSSFQEGHIDLLTTDHSPTVPELKLLEEGDFLKAWGGISSLQVREFSC